MKRKASVFERFTSNTNKKKVFIVSYNLDVNGQHPLDWIDFGVYFNKEEAEIVKKMIENNELNILRGEW